MWSTSFDCFQLFLTLLLSVWETIVAAEHRIEWPYRLEQRVTQTSPTPVTQSWQHQGVPAKKWRLRSHWSAVVSTMSGISATSRPSPFRCKWMPRQRRPSRHLKTRSNHSRSYKSVAVSPKLWPAAVNERWVCNFGPTSPIGNQQLEDKLVLSNQSGACNYPITQTVVSKLFFSNFISSAQLVSYPISLVRTRGKQRGYEGLSGESVWKVEQALDSNESAFTAASWVCLMARI